MKELFKNINFKTIDYSDKETRILLLVVALFSFGLGFLGLIASIVSLFIIKKASNKKYSYLCIGLSSLKVILIVVLLIIFYNVKINNNLEFSQDLYGSDNNYSDYYGDYYGDYGNYGNYNDFFGNGNFYGSFRDFYDMFPESVPDSNEDYSI